MLIGFVYGIIFYKTSDQIDDDFRFWGYVALMIMSAMVAQGYGQLASIVTSDFDHKLSHTLAIATHNVALIFNQYVIPLNQLPQCLSWFGSLLSWKQIYELELYLIYGFDRCPDGLSPKLLWQNDLDDRDKFYLNLYLLIANIILFRFVNLTILLIMTHRRN